MVGVLNVLAEIHKTSHSVILDAAAKLRMLRPELAAFVTCARWRL